MELSKLFTKKNIEILRLLSKESLHIRDIAAKLDISPAKVHSTIQLFKKNNLIKENQDKNKIVISLNKDSLLLKNIENEKERRSRNSTRLFTLWLSSRRKDASYSASHRGEVFLSA